jgi:hypothetical protein
MPYRAERDAYCQEKPECNSRYGIRNINYEVKDG